MSQPKYKFYATLLDKFQGYISSSETYQEFWGFAENPSKTEEEFEKEQFNGLINTINRVPFESELADKGTAFNEVVDCLIENRKSDKIEVEKIYTEFQTQEIEPNTGAFKFFKKLTILRVKYKHHIFDFDYSLCKQFSDYLKGALTQQRVTGTIETKYGSVEIYGNLDQLMPFKCVDIKTTGKYHFGKFRKNWQHIVYPYCLIQSGNPINEFEYAVTDFKSTWNEWYVFKDEIDTPRLIEHCEILIEFLEQNRELITDKKIFALE